MEEIELMNDEEFKQINGYPSYYISNYGRCYNSKTKRFVGGNSGGYVRVKLYNDDVHQLFNIHELVMKSFGPPMPAGMTDIDHKNHIRTDNRIENLRWTTRSQNLKNKSSHKDVQYEYFDEIPANDEDIIEVRDYGNHEFEDLYYADNYFYFDTGVSFRRLHINYDKRNGYAYVIAYDTDSKNVQIRYTQFKKLYGID